MAFWSRKPVANGEALTAAAEKIDTHDRKEAEARAKASAQWQKDAWSYYDDVPELWYGMNYIANALRRIRIYPATWEDPMEPPIPLERSAGGIAAAANAELDRLRDADGTHGTIIHDLALQLSVPGEGYLAGWEQPKLDDNGKPIPGTIGEEHWGIYSIDEIRPRQGEDKWYLYGGPADRQGHELPEDLLLNRIWRQHPHWHAQADSALRALGGTCRELLQMDRMYRSEGRSRTNAGILLIPDEINLREKKRPGQSTEEGQGTIADPFVRALITALVTPTTDEESAANVAPGVIKAKADLIEKFRHLTFGRDFTVEGAKRYDKLLLRLANGVDLPNSVLTGIEHLNHWSAWLVSEDEFDSHLAPLVEMMCAALTKVFLEPALGEVTVDPGKRAIVWYDASALISHPNKSADADGAFDRFAISYDSYRRYKGYSEDDAPDDAEIQARIKIVQETKPTRGAIDAGTGPPSGASTTGIIEPPSIQASAAIAKALGLRLAGIDRQLRMDVQAACESVIQQSLTAAGGVDDIDWTDLEASWESLTAEAQRTIRGIALEYGDFDDALVEEVQDDDRRNGYLVLVAALTAYISFQLYSPAPHAEQFGEITERFTVPPGIVREAMAVAGGAAPPPPRGPAGGTSAQSETATSTASSSAGAAASTATVIEDPITGEPAGGVATGSTSREVFAEVGLITNMWVWVYGNADRPFPPHENLDTVEFNSFHDEVLTVQPEDAWLGVEFYRPGDHNGCQCDFAPVMEESGTVADEEAAAAALEEDAA